MNRLKILFFVLYLGSALNLNAQFNDTIIRFTVIRDTLHDESVFRIEHQATDGHDGAHDAPKVFSSPHFPQIWSVGSDNSNLAINSFPFYTAKKSFPLGFKTTVADSITLKATAFIRIDTNIRIYLHDMIANRFINVKVDSVYRFYSPVVDNATRFRVYFASETTYSADTLSYGLPDSLITLRIKDGHYVANNPQIKAFNVIVEPGAALTLNLGSSLNVKNYFKLKSDANGTASFIESGILNLSYPAIIQKYLPDNTITGWTISSPISDADASLFSGADGLWEFDPNAGQWTVFNSGLLDVGKGYVTKFSGINKTMNFIGSQNNSEIFVNLIRSGDYSGNFGWNLVGNPYPSAINWDLMPPETKTNINEAIYFRRTDGGVSTYVNGIGLNQGSSIIPSFQAFWIQVSLYENAGSLLFTNGIRMHASNGLYKSSIAEQNTLRIAINGNDEAVIRLLDGTTNSFDKAFDATKMFADNAALPQIYTGYQSDAAYAVNTLPSSNEAVVVPMGLVNASSDDVITFNGIESFFGHLLYLEDTYLQQFNLLDNYYSVKLNTSLLFDENRFRVHLIPQTASLAYNTDEGMFSYVSDNTLLVWGLEPDKYKYWSIINITGGLTSSGTIENQNNYLSIGLDYPAGLYLITLSDDNSNKSTLRFVITP